MSIFDFLFKTKNQRQTELNQKHQNRMLQELGTMIWDAQVFFEKHQNSINHCTISGDFEGGVLTDLVDLPDIGDIWVEGYRNRKIKEASKV